MLVAPLGLSHFSPHELEKFFNGRSSGFISQASISVELDPSGGDDNSIDNRETGGG